MAALGVGLGACAPEVPESCVTMCEAATTVYAGCLEPVSYTHLTLPTILRV